MPGSKGVYIAFEGGEGSGKDTQLKLLLEKLSLGALGDFSGRQILTPHTLYSTEAGTALSKIIKDPSRPEWAVQTEILMFATAMSEFAQKVVIPARAEGSVILGNRSLVSTLAYECYGYGRKDLIPFARTVLSAASLDAEPDFIVMLDGSPEKLLARSRARNDKAGKRDRFDEKDLAFHSKVRQGYQAEIPRYPHTVIDAEQSIEAIHEQVVQAVRPLLVTVLPNISAVSA